MLQEMLRQAQNSSNTFKLIDTEGLSRLASSCCYPVPFKGSLMFGCFLFVTEYSRLPSFSAFGFGLVTAWFFVLHFLQVLIIPVTWRSLLWLETSWTLGAEVEVRMERK